MTNRGLPPPVSVDLSPLRRGIVLRANETYRVTDAIFIFTTIDRKGEEYENSLFPFYRERLGANHS
jgi:hypothetical protein